MKNPLRNQFRLILIILLLSSVNQLSAQDQDSTKFGFGATFFNMGEYAYEFQAANTIYLTYDVSEKLRIEPTIGFALSKGLNQITVGVGIFKKKELSHFNLLYGARLGSGNSERFFIAPTLGGEYLIIKHFSVGSEVQLRVSEVSKTWSLLTNSSVIVRFYF